MYNVRDEERWAIIDERGMICDGSPDDMNDVWYELVNGNDGGDYFDAEDLHPPILLVRLIQVAE